jgi:hypothetical protein
MKILRVVAAIILTLALILVPAFSTSSADTALTSGYPGQMDLENDGFSLSVTGSGGGGGGGDGGIISLGTRLLCVANSRFQSITGLPESPVIGFSRRSPDVDWTQTALETYGKNPVYACFPPLDIVQALEKEAIDAALITDHPDGNLTDYISSGLLTLLPWNTAAVDAVVDSSYGVIVSSALPLRVLLPGIPGYLK